MGIYILVILCLFSILNISLSVFAENQENTPEDFVRMIYKYFADENFDAVYNNFLEDLKDNLKKDKYVSFQKSNFEKYNLKYSNIKVSSAKKINYQDLPDKIKFKNTADNYYKLKVSYQLNFEHLGQKREEESEKDVFIAEKILLKTGDKNQYYLIWNPEAIKGKDEDEIDE